MLPRGGVFLMWLFCVFMFSRRVLHAIPSEREGGAFKRIASHDSSPHHPPKKAPDWVPRWMRKRKAGSEEAEYSRLRICFALASLCKQRTPCGEQANQHPLGVAARDCLEKDFPHHPPKKAPEWVPRWMVGEAGFEPAKSWTTDLQSAPFGRSGIPPRRLAYYSMGTMACQLIFAKKS